MTRGAAALLAFAVWLDAAVVAAAPGGDRAYTVAEFPVEATAKDAVAAKQKAHAEGTREAFRALLKRIVPVAAYTRLTRLKNADAASLVTGIKVRSEQNSSTQYIATLDYTFDPGNVRALLKREGVPFIDTQAEPVSLIPLARETGGDGTSGQAVALWSQSWDELDLDNTVTPLAIDRQAAAPDADGVAALLNGRVDLSVGNKPAVFAVADVDEPGKKVTVALIGRDSAGPIDLRRIYKLDHSELGYTLELASVVALGIIEGRWKAITARARGGIETIAGPGLPVTIDVQFASQGEWNDLRRQLLDTPGVDDVRVEGISARSAQVRLLFPGGGAGLAETLAKRGMSLRQEGSGWSLRASF